MYARKFFSLVDRRSGSLNSYVKRNNMQHQKNDKIDMNFLHERSTPIERQLTARAVKIKKNWTVDTKNRIKWFCS